MNEKIDVSQLRSLFDTGSSEYQTITFQERITLLENALVGRKNMLSLYLEYRNYFDTEVNRPDISNAAQIGLCNIIDHLLKKEYKEEK